MNLSLGVWLVMVASITSNAQCFEGCLERFGSSIISPYDRQERSYRATDAMGELIGCRAPDFKLRSLAGDSLKMDEWRGKVVVLNFWFIACPPCVAEIPALNRLVDHYRKEDVVFVAFALDDALSLVKFLKREEFKFEMVAGGPTFAEYYCIVSGYPTTMIIDKTGILREIPNPASMSVYRELKGLIDKYLAE
jgi:peroxiredoxin